MASTKSAVSPLAPTSYPDIPPIEGVRFATAAVGIRYKERTDVMLALFDKGTKVAGVFTRSKCASAPVEWCQARLKSGKARALVVNSGNANAFTGKTGAKAAALVGIARRRQPSESATKRSFWRRQASSANRSMRRNSTASSRS